tara:strand:+ start:181 stop:393 length:213 start_codon:yes stop_codon:yes gene_type:complete
MAKKKIKLKISRNETWFPEIEVDDHLTDEEIIEMVEGGDYEDHDHVYDEYQRPNKYTLETLMTTEIAKGE